MAPEGTPVLRPTVLGPEAGAALVTAMTEDAPMLPQGRGDTGRALGREPAVPATAGRRGKGARRGGRAARRRRVDGDEPDRPTGAARASGAASGIRARHELHRARPGRAARARRPGARARRVAPARGVPRAGRGRPVAVPARADARRGLRRAAVPPPQGAARSGRRSDRGRHRGSGGGRRVAVDALLPVGRAGEGLAVLAGGGGACLVGLREPGGRRVPASRGRRGQGDRCAGRGSGRGAGAAGRRARSRESHGRCDRRVPRRPAPCRRRRAGDRPADPQGGAVQDPHGPTARRAAHVPSGAHRDRRTRGPRRGRLARRDLRGVRVRHRDEPSARRRSAAVVRSRRGVRRGHGVDVGAGARGPHPELDLRRHRARRRDRGHRSATSAVRGERVLGRCPDRVDQSWRAFLPGGALG